MLMGTVPVLEYVDAVSIMVTSDAASEVTVWACFELEVKGMMNRTWGFLELFGA